MIAPTHLTSRQIRTILKGVMASTCQDPIEMQRSIHRQRILREIRKLGAQKWHGEWMLESTAATQWINSHLVSDPAVGSDATNLETTSPEG